MYGDPAVCSSWPRLAPPAAGNNANDSSQTVANPPSSKTACIKLSDSLAVLVEKEGLIPSGLQHTKRVPAVIYGTLQHSSNDPSSSSALPSTGAQSQSANYAYTVVRSSSSESPHSWTGLRVQAELGPASLHSPSVSVRKVWEHELSEVVLKAIGTDRSCHGQDSFKHQKDESVLRSVCLDDAIAIAGETKSGQINIVLMDVVTGAVRMSRELGHKNQVHLIDMRMDFNRLVVVYENMRLRRNELKLVEVFEEFKAMDRLASFKRSVINKWQGRRKKSKTSQKKTITSVRYYDETFVIDLQDITSIALTQSIKRITPQTLILASRLNNRIYQIPHQMFSARRPIAPPVARGSDTVSSRSPEFDFPVPDSAIESVAHPYDAKLPLISIAFFDDASADGNYSTTTAIEGIDQKDQLWCKPIAQRESGTEIYYGSRYIDTFRPALGYDTLPDSFSKIQTSISLIGLVIGIAWVFRSLFKSQKKSTCCA